MLNGLLTARLVVAAMGLIRPFPSCRKAPSARGLAMRALTDLRKAEELQPRSGPAGSVPLRHSGGA